MMLRPAREALGMQRGMDEIRWLFVGTAAAALAVNPLFGLLGFHALLVFAPTSVVVRGRRLECAFFRPV